MCATSPTTSACRRVRLEAPARGRRGARAAPASASAEPAAGEPVLAALSPAQELSPARAGALPRAAHAHAGDDLDLEPSHFPAPWQELAGHLLLSPGADIHSLAALAVVQAHGELHRAAFRWASADLAERLPAVSDPRADLGEAVREIRRTRLKDQLHRLGRELAECERAGDGENLGRLSRERLSLTRALQDLSGHSGFGSSGPGLAACGPVAACRQRRR